MGGDKEFEARVTGTMLGKELRDRFHERVSTFGSQLSGKDYLHERGDWFGEEISAGALESLVLCLR